MYMRSSYTMSLDIFFWILHTTNSKYSITIMLRILVTVILWLEAINTCLIYITNPDSINIFTNSFLSLTIFYYLPSTEISMYQNM